MNERVIRKGTTMKRIVTLALFGVACLLALPSVVQARYADGMNLYEFVRSNPVVNRDPSGLWTEIKRKKDEARAECCAETGDTWGSLAEKIKLDPSEYTKWAMRKGGGEVEANPVPGATYTVPNTVVVYTSKKTSLADRVATVYGTTAANFFRERAIDAGKSYEANNYRVIYHTGKADIKLFITDWQTSGIYAFAMGGHGGTEGGKWYGFSAKPGADSPVGPDAVHPPYKLQAIYAYFCGSADPQTVPGLDPKGNPYPAGHWRDHVSPTGRFVGYTGDVNMFTLPFKRVESNPQEIPK